MRIGEIMRAHDDAYRKVGIRFDTRIHAMTAACALYRTWGLNVHIDDNIVSLDVVQPLALPAMQILERATGVMGFNEWQTP